MSTLRLTTLFSVSFFTLLFAALSQATVVTDYLPSNHSYKSTIPTPKLSFGFGLGEKHVRYDQLLSYLNTIEQFSDRVLMTEMGKTQQLRSQVLLTISSPKNLKKLKYLVKATR